MANDAGELLDAADLESPNLNPSYALRPDYAIRSVALTPREVYPETSSQLLAPLSTTYMPPGTQMASFAAEPGQPVNLIQSGADLRPQQPQVAQVVPQGSIAQQVAPPLRAPSPTANQPAPPPATFVNPAAAPKRDPNSALQSRRNALEVEAKREYDQGNGWFRKVMDDEGAAKSRDNYQRLQDEIAKIDQQIQTQNTNQQMSKNYHLRKPVPATVDPAAIPELALDEWANDGNVGAFQALLGSPHADRAKGYMPQGMNALGKDTAKASDLFSKLDDASKMNQPAYDRARANLINGAGGVVNAQYFGMTEGNIPKTREEWSSRRELVQGPIKATTQMVSGYQRQQSDQMLPKPVVGDAGTAVVSDSTLVGGAVSSHAKARSLPSLGGANTTLYDNSTPDIRDYKQNGKWTNWGSAEKKEASKMISENPEIKGVLDQHNMAVKFDGIVQEDKNYKDSTGRTMIADGAAGVFRNMSEMARAAGNIGLIKVWEHELGMTGNLLNKAYTNWGTYQNWLNSGRTGEEPRLVPRVDEWSPEVVAAFKRIGEFNKHEIEKQLPRASGVAEYVGQHAGTLEHVGVSPEAAKILKPYREAAEQEHRNALDSRDRIIINGRHYELPIDHSVDPKSPGFVPKGSYSKSIEAVNENRVAPTPFTGGAPAVPFMPNAPAAAPPPPARPAGGALRPLAATPAASLIQSLAPPPAPAPTAQVAQAQLPASWGVGTGAGPPPVAQPSAPGGGAGQPAAPAPAPVTVPNYLRGNPVASTVYSTAAQTATNLSQGNAVVGNNVAAIVTSSAKNESNFKPHELHDKNQATGRYAGYGLFGHQGDRLSNMQKHGGVPVVGMPGEAVAPEAQTTFYTREIMDAMKKDPFIAKVLNDPKASAEDLTRVQMRMERPKGYTGPGSEEKASNWAGRLAATQSLLLGQRGQLTSDPKQAEVNYWASQSRMMKAIPQNAPAIGATAANIATTPFGPAVQAPATLAGGVAGGVVKNAMIGTPEQQTLGGYTEAGVKGGAEALPMMIPGNSWKALAGRALTAGAVEGGIEAYDTGDIPKALNVAGGSTLVAGTAETFMHALGKGFSGIYKAMTNNNKVAMENAGKILSEQKPKTMLADGTTVENKAYTTAQEWAKSKNIDPDHLAHAFEQASSQATRREALLSRPSYVAKKEAGRDLDKVVQDVGGTTPGMPAAKTRQALSGIESPVSRIDSGLVPPAFRADAETAARTMAGAGKPTPTNFGQVMDNFAQARTDLLYKRANAEAITPNHPDFARKKEITKAYDDLGQHIRLEQEKLIRATLPPNQQQPLIDHLRAASTRYRNAIMAGGDDIVATIAKGDAKGNQARTAFNNLAGNDQDAKNMMRAVTTMEGRTGKISGLAVTIGISQALHFVPIVGTVAAGAVGVLSAAKLSQLAKDYMTQKGAGKIVTMKELVSKELSKTQNVMGRAGATIGGSVGANAARSLTQPAPASP